MKNNTDIIEAKQHDEQKVVLSKVDDLEALQRDNTFFIQQE